MVQHAHAFFVRVGQLMNIALLQVINRPTPNMFKSSLRGRVNAVTLLLLRFRFNT
jgi:hypothetical protein